MKFNNKKIQIAFDCEEYYRITKKHQKYFIDGDLRRIDGDLRRYTISTSIRVKRTAAKTWANFRLLEDSTLSTYGMPVKTREILRNFKYFI